MDEFKFIDDIKTRSVQWHPKTNKLIQIPSDGLEYALVSDDYRQIHQLAWCRDIIQTTIYAYLNSLKISIYGHTYDPAKDPPVSRKRTRLMLTNWKDKEFDVKLLTSAIPMIHEFEDELGMSRTKVEKIAKPPSIYVKSGVWMVDSSIRWSKSPPMISLFTLLLRIGLVRDLADDFREHLLKIELERVKPYHSADPSQVSNATAGIQRILKYGDRSLFHSKIEKNYPIVPDVDLKHFHNHTGIVAYSKEYTRGMHSYWHRFEGVV